MKKSHLLQSAVFFVTLLFSQDLFAFPTGVLYWATTNYPDQFYTYDIIKPYNGAVDAIDYACRQSPGTGTYSGTVRVILSFPAATTGYCRNTRPFFPGAFDGNLYTADLYCNGERRIDEMDDSPCQSTDVINIKGNLGSPQCEMP